MLFGVAAIPLLGFFGAADRSEVRAAECEVTGFLIDEGCVSCCWRRRLDGARIDAGTDSRRVLEEGCSPESGYIVRMTGSAFGPSFGAVSLAGLDVYVQTDDVWMDMDTVLKFADYSLAAKYGEAAGLQHCAGDESTSPAGLFRSSTRASQPPACAHKISDFDPESRAFANSNSWSFENCSSACTQRQECLYWPEESRVGLVEGGVPSTQTAQVLWMVVTVIVCGLAFGSVVRCIHDEYTTKAARARQVAQQEETKRQQAAALHLFGSNVPRQSFDAVKPVINQL
jgi:hypothetical protein